MDKQTDLRQIVADGYDQIAERYERWIAYNVIDEVRPRYAAVLLDDFSENAAVLELGCGGGGATTQQLAKRFTLTGVDISARQIELAKRNVPHGEFIHGDMTRVEFPQSSFDGVAAFYTFTHLPHGELPELLQRSSEWLRPGGLLVASMGVYTDPGTFERRLAWCADAFQRL